MPEALKGVHSSGMELQISQTLDKWLEEENHPRTPALKAIRSESGFKIVRLLSQKAGGTSK